MKKIGVIFIHGLTGGPETWRSNVGHRFGDLLLQSEIGEHIEVHYFDYYTKILSIFDSAAAKRILGRIPLLKKISFFKGRVQKNQPVEQLAEQLSTWIRLELSHLDEVVLIAHSMGGLIAKDYVLNSNIENSPRTTGFLSIAVPHKGSLSAQILQPINRNAAELVPLNEYTSRLNDRWVDKPPTHFTPWYVIALHDECVDKESAIPGLIAKEQKFTVDHDHLSVCKPDSALDPVAKCAVLLIRQLIEKNSTAHQIAVASNMPQPSYEKEIFVIKLLLGEIGKPGIDMAKEAFFQAEIIEKLSNATDRQNIARLQRLIVNLYRSVFIGHSGNNDRNALFAEIHRLIVAEDGAALKSAVKSINFLHKQGLLHKAANELTDEVFWATQYCESDIEGRRQ